MAILADSLVADVEELSNNVVDLDIAEHMDEDRIVLDDDDIDNVFKLQKSPRYIDIIQKIEENVTSKGKGVVLQVDVDDPEYKFILACSTLLVDIENEIVIIHNFIRDKYRLKFPEFESILPHPIDYARVVRKIGNQMDVTLVDLEGLLPTAIISIVSVSASTTIGKPLPNNVLHKTNEACNRAISLDSSKKKLFQFVKDRMGYIAPNLSAVVGRGVAAKLMGAAGGLSSLEKMLRCDVELLGAKRKDLPNFPSHIYDFRPLGAGYINQCEIFNSAPPNFRIQTYQLVANKCTLAARVDSTKGDPTGEYGRSLVEEILKRIKRWKNPRPVPVPVPTDQSEPCKRKRSGRVPPQRKRKNHTPMIL
ncbi:hypothetical protein RND71_041187 [Anisodus tanguticus]|uniref:Nop domain-containing protein n=1 Tax=Anisodus tanguticus TaxID=243964 RepID=A0AAE1QU46_9SOLA|nr:hypothetical protein RND71_041187 [Anisodus tanguticus]